MLSSFELGLIPIPQTILASVRRVLEPGSDPIPWSYTRPIVMPLACLTLHNSSSLLRMQTQ